VYDRVDLVVASKLRAPPQRSTVVPRHHLTDTLTVGFAGGAPVGLVCAPAGFGKTTLLTSYLDRTDGAAAWFQVDTHDNDPARFWTHLYAAIQQLDHTSTGSIPVTWLRAGDWLAVISAVIAELDRLGGTTVVIDDYHHITSSVVHEHLEQLLQWLPPGTTVVIATRIDPPIPCLGRLRVQGGLVEIRAADLAFDSVDGAALLAGAADLDLTPAGAEELVARTEGWAAGLYLAGLSMKRHRDPALVLAAFDGDDRLVADYLRSEFMAGLDQPTRRFMLRTSVVDELTGPLCDAVVSSGDSAARLRELEGVNTLLIPLDTRGERYRYHHLLAHWLRSELTLTEPALVPELHSRAATWFRRERRMELAFAHAMAAEDRELAATIVEEGWKDTMLSGHVLTARDWFSSLGSELVAASAPLATAQASLCLNTGRPHEEVERWLEQARQAATPGDRALQAEIDQVSALHCRQKGDLGAALELARSVVDGPDGPARCQALTTLGSVLYLHGNLAQAEAVLQGAVAASDGDGDALDRHLASGHLAAVYYERGHRREAGQRAEATLDDARAVRLDNWPTLLVAHHVLGQLALDEEEPDRASDHLETALRQSRQARYRPLELMILLSMARLHAGQHHGVEARRVLESAQRMVADMPDPGRLADLVPVTGRQIAMATAARPQPSTGLSSSLPTADGSGRPLIEDLTSRELSVLRLFASDLSLRDVGRELYVSHNTVKGHAKAIYRKLSVHSRQEAVARASSLGLL